MFQIYCRRSQQLEWNVDIYNDLRDDDDKDNDICRSRNLKDFICNDDFSARIDTCVDKSRSEIFLMVLEYSLRHRSSLSEICSLLRLINTIFSRTLLPDTRWIFDNIINSKSTLEYHGICPNCSKYLGKIRHLKSSMTCEVCLEIVEFDGPSSSNIFLLIDPTESIKLLLEDNQQYYEYIVKERKYDGRIRDIFDGKCYRSFVKSLPTNERHNYVTTIFNTDGAPRFECSQYSIWPIYLQLNEIPVKSRLKRIITCGMWFGKNKPKMTAFLQPFTDTIVRLSTEGIDCTINNEKRLIKVYTLICCVDSVARAPMQGVKLFNGQYGCNWCLHKGEWYEGSMRYPILQSCPEERTKRNTIEFMTRATNEECDDVYGVKCTSPLINLPYFDIVQGFVPDYMHSCLSGVGKQITKYFLKCMIETSTVEEMNKILLQIKVPHQIGRLSRSFDDINHWKSREWENFILYYSLPLFRLILNERMVKYWILFVESLHTLLRCDISINDLNKVDENLYKFAFLTEKLFSKKSMTFNVHQLLHISQSVLNWGPLWAHSTFSFESANHDTLQAIYCAKGVNLQIVRYINMQHSVHVLRNSIYPHASPLVIDYCEELSTKKIKKSCKLVTVTYLGNGTSIDKNTLKLFNVCVKSTIAYERVVKDGCLLMSSTRKNKRSDNSFAMLSDNTFIRILYFLVDNKNKKEITLCNIVNTSTSICNFLTLIRNIGTEIIAIETKKIKQVCVFIQVHENCYIATLPNSYHY